MVDYSKWDQLDVSDDEDEGLGKPRVQRFDAPQTVTIEDLAAAGPCADHREDVLQCRELGERALRRGDAAEGVRLLEKALRLAGGADCPGLQDLLAAARRQAAGAAAPTAAPRPREPRRANGGTFADRTTPSQRRRPSSRTRTSSNPCTRRR